MTGPRAALFRSAGLLAGWTAGVQPARTTPSGRPPRWWRSSRPGCRRSSFNAETERVVNAGRWYDTQPDIRFGRAGARRSILWRKSDHTGVVSSGLAGRHTAAKRPRSGHAGHESETRCVTAGTESGDLDRLLPVAPSLGNGKTQREGALPTSCRDTPPDNGSCRGCVSAGLLARGSRSPIRLPGRTALSQWLVDESKLAAYSCGGSAGLAPASLLDPVTGTDGVSMLWVGTAVKRQAAPT